jgi:hypothetical protein
MLKGKEEKRVKNDENIVLVCLLVIVKEEERVL